MKIRNIKHDLNIQNIIERFSVISNMTFEEISPWAEICKESAQQIKDHLRKGVNIKKHENRLCAAAGALSFYKYVLYSSYQNGLSGFAAGEIQIKTDKKFNVQLASAIWIDAKNSIADLLVDDEFVFERI